jgi:5-methylcytosine-specific restriction enzyme A
VEVFDWYIGEIADHEGSDVLTDETHIARLRRRALKAASQGAQKSPRETTRRYNERSAAVRGYVLARAAGTCESCGSPAPFSRPDGTPCLEPHHTTKLSDGGPDKPRSVGAICPNCYREIHHGAEGDEKNRRLQQRLVELEDGDPPAS